MAPRSNFVHVTPEDGKWALTRQKGGRPQSTHRTQAAAITAARRVAKREATELVIHGRNGKIRDRVSYGSDPRRSRG
jgi:Uncharacterized protein conserved in bacteria (DUF2188)